MALPFRFDLPGCPPPLLDTLTMEQLGMWFVLVVELWASGPMPGAEVVNLEIRRMEKRTLYPNLIDRGISERFLLEEVAPDRWSFEWLEQHRTKQAEKSDKAKASGKAGGRGNTHRRKMAKRKANALPVGSTGEESERFTTAEKRTLSDPGTEGEKRTLSEAVNDEKSERFEARPEGARVRVPTDTLFHEAVLLKEEEGTRGKKAAKAVDPRKTMFRNSEVFDLATFRDRMPKEIAIGIDVDYYYAAVLDWSDRKDTKELTTANGWIATARSFMRNDRGKSGVKMLKAAEQMVARNQAANEYLDEE